MIRPAADQAAERATLAEPDSSAGFAGHAPSAALAAMMGNRAFSAMVARVRAADGHRERDPMVALTRTLAAETRERRLARSKLSERLTALAQQQNTAVFDLLRQHGRLPEDAAARAALEARFAAGSTELQLALTLLEHGPEQLWPDDVLRRSGPFATQLLYPEESGIGPRGTEAIPPVAAYFFPGVTERRALIIGGVHGSEPQGVAVVELLRARLKRDSAQGIQPFFTTVLVPVLIERTHRTHERNVPGAGRTGGAAEPNRTFPQPGEDYGDARARAKATGHELRFHPPGGPRAGRPPQRGLASREILPENRVLIRLIEQFHPERIASVHAHHLDEGEGARSEGSGRSGNDPGIFVDPRRPNPNAGPPDERARQAQLREQAADDQLARALLHDAQGRVNPELQSGGRNPFMGNVGGTVRFPETVHYDPAAAETEGYSLGDWAPTATATRAGITTVTVEIPQYGQGEEARADTLAVEEATAATLREIFLGDPAAAAPPARPAAQPTAPRRLQRQPASQSGAGAGSPGTIGGPTDEELRQAATNLELAVYTTHSHHGRRDGERFRNAARQFAADHRAVGLTAEGLRIGAEAAMSAGSADDVVRQIRMTVAAVQARVGDAGRQASVLALFAHGVHDSDHPDQHYLNLGAGNEIANAVRAADPDADAADAPPPMALGDFVTQVDSALGDTAKVVLYACELGDTVGGGASAAAKQDALTHGAGSFADEMRRELNELGAHREVWGHRTTADTIGNPRWRMFGPDADQPILPEPQVTEDQSPALAYRRQQRGQFMSETFRGLVERELRRRARQDPQIRAALRIVDARSTNQEVLFWIAREMPFAPQPLAEGTPERWTVRGEVMDWFARRILEAQMVPT